MSKKIWLFIIAFLVMCAVIFTLPKKHSYTFEGIMYQLGEENKDFEKTTSVHVDGKMKRNLLGVRTFTGFINLEG